MVATFSQASLGLVGIGSAIRLGEKRSIGPPLHINHIADNKSVFRSYFEPTDAPLRGGLYDLGEHLAQRIATAHHFAVGRKEFHIVWELRHQAFPIASIKGCEVLSDDLLWRRLRNAVRQMADLSGGNGDDTDRNDGEYCDAKVERDHG